MKDNYSVYKSGLKKGDFVSYRRESFFSNSFSKKETCIVLNKEFLFTNETKWGDRKFFIYDVMNLNRKFYKIKTQNMKILKRIGAL